MLAGSASRTLRGTETVLSWQPQGSDGEPADPGVVTVGIVRADLSELVASGGVTAGTGTAARTYTLTPEDTANLDILTATWTNADDVIVAITRHEIVGGYYFTSAELRAAEPSLADASRDTLARLLLARAEVETFIEAVCGCSFVPRFGLFRGFVRDGSVDYDGDTTITLPPYLRSVRWGRYWSQDSVTSTVLTETELAGIALNDTGVISVPYGDHLYEIGCEHGADAPPADIKAVAMTYARVVANRHRSGVSDRAVSMTTPDGASLNFGRIGTTWRPTGIEWIDEILRRPDYNFRLAGTLL